MPSAQDSCLQNSAGALCGYYFSRRLDGVRRHDSFVHLFRKRRERCFVCRSLARRRRPRTPTVKGPGPSALRSVKPRTSAPGRRRLRRWAAAPPARRRRTASRATVAASVTLPRGFRLLLCGVHRADLCVVLQARLRRRRRRRRHRRLLQILRHLKSKQEMTVRPQWAGASEDGSRTHWALSWRS